MQKEMSAEVAEHRRMLRHETKTNQTWMTFLKRLCDHCPMSPDFAEQAAVTVLCQLEQRLMGDEAHDLEAQLPLKLQILLTNSEKHALPTEKFGRDEFLRRVASDLNMQPDEVEPIVRAVLLTVREQVSEGEIDDVMHQLPMEYRDLWQSTQ